MHAAASIFFERENPERIEPHFIPRSENLNKIRRLGANKGEAGNPDFAPAEF